MGTRKRGRPRKAEADRRVPIMARVLPRTLIAFRGAAGKRGEQIQGNIWMALLPT